MKKKVLLLVSGVCMLLGQTMASTVSVQTAQTVAKNFYMGAAPAATNVSPTLAYTRSESDGTVDFYVFDMAPLKGFVIVSADDILKPVMGYSTESNFDMNFGRTGLIDWMKGAASHVYGSIQQHMQANTSITQMWTACRAGVYHNPSRAAVAGPLLRSNWDQSPNYNALCPYNTRDNDRAVTGCVATAMAQIMKFWNYPAQGQGNYSYTCTASDGYNYGSLSASFNHTYNWAGMPNLLSGANADVAQLMYDCGVSVAMSYGDMAQGGSGAFVLQSHAWGNGPCAEKSFKDYFLYDPNSMQGVDMGSYTSQQWYDMMKNEINVGRPVQYEGDDPSEGGHTWVMDGYDNNNFLHMNWGWSGSYNGYFATSSLNAGGANFANNEAALIGIQPLFPYSLSIQSASQQVCLGSTLQLDAQGPASGTYTWAPTTGLTCSTCASTGAHPTVTTLYTVTCDSAGVKVPSTILVTVVPAVSADFTVPNTQACATPASFTFQNKSKFGTTYAWDFGDGTTSTLAAPTHVYQNFGLYDVTLTTTGDCGTDTKAVTQFIGVNNTAPTAPSQAICAGSSATLSGVAAGDIKWYANAAGGSSLYDGSTFTTPTLNNTTTYYAEAQILGPLVTAGIADNTVGTGTYYTQSTVRGVVFTSYAPQVLTYVDVYAQTAGNATITLTNSSGTTLQSTTVSVDQGYNTLQLNFNIPVGTNMQLSTNAAATQLYRTSGAGVSYPYYSQDSSLIITGSSASATVYYFFYNWQLQSMQCVSNRTPVTAYVLTNGANSFSYSSASGNVVTFTAAVNAPGSTYSWNFGDGTSSTDQNPVHTYSTGGNYTVTLSVSNGSCNGQVSATISAAAGATSVQDLNVVQNMAAYPNPVKDQLEISISAVQASDMKMDIYDGVGKVIMTRDVQINTGGNTFNENVGAYAAGVYTIVLHDASSRATARFVKE